MTDTATAPETEALAPVADVDTGPAPAPTGRTGLLTLATLVGGSAVVMLFLGLCGAYLAGRDAAGAGWFPAEAELPNLAAAMLTVGLGMSSFTAVWVAHSARRGDRRGVLWALGLTAVLGAAHVNGMTFVWSTVGLSASAGGYATMMYAMTGAHWVLTIAGLAAIAALGVRAIGGQLTGRSSEPAVAFAIGWQFLVAAWGAVYTFVFLVK